MIRARAEAALAETERREGVRVLLAVESGSRAWGFPSRDSDYDLRFIYVRPLSDYLSVSIRRDVIEQPIYDALDLSGWDVRKALGIMVRSNAVLLEWLALPVVYRSDGATVEELAALARATAHLPALEYHYDRLARGAWLGTPDGTIRLKSYFYALRPALALLWLRRHGAPPPVDMTALLAGSAVPLAIRAEIEGLRQRKATATETDLAARQSVLDAFLAEALATPAPPPPAWDRTEALMSADLLFRRLLRRYSGAQAAELAAG